MEDIGFEPFLSKLAVDKLAATLEKQNAISLSLSRQQEKASLPPKEVLTFDGLDITVLKSSMIPFHREVEEKCEDGADKFYYLEMYTSGCQGISK